MQPPVPRLAQPCEPQNRFSEAVRAALLERSAPTQLSAQPLVIGYETCIDGRNYSIAYWPSCQRVGEAVLRVLDGPEINRRFIMMRVLTDVMQLTPVTVEEAISVCTWLGVNSLNELGVVKVMAWAFTYELQENAHYVHETRLSPFLFRYRVSQL